MQWREIKLQVCLIFLKALGRTWNYLSTQFFFVDEPNFQYMNT